VESPQGIEKNTALAKQAKNVFKKIILKIHLTDYLKIPILNCVGWNLSFDVF